MTFTKPTAAGVGRYVRDVAERVVRSFLWAFGAQLVASGWFSVDQITDLSVVARAGVAGIAAVLALLGGLVAKAVGNSNSASVQRDL